MAVQFLLMEFQNCLVIKR